MNPIPPATEELQLLPESQKQESPTTRRRRVRDWFVWLHRVTGLFLVVFLVVAGITGTFLVFYYELDAALNPRLSIAHPPTHGAAMLDPFELRERVAAQLPDEKISEVIFNRKEGSAIEVWLPKSEQSVYINPYDGQVLGTRRWEEWSGWRLSIMPFIYRLHYSLALGEVGSWLFGIAALLWTVDCFVGAYLTFPPAQKRRIEGKPARGWLRRWGPSWLMKAGQLFSTIFTFHRAAGLWLWAMLLVFAWSAVGFNLNPVFNPVMSVFGYSDHEHPPELAQPIESPALDWHAAHARGRELMKAEALKRGFTVREDGSLGYEADHGSYSYRVHSSLDLSQRWPRTEIHFDGNTGLLQTFAAPTGQAVGDTVASWLFALHMGAVGGWPYRIFVAVFGLLIAALAISGIWIWWRKRAARLKTRKP